ncbi:MAG: NUDIX hydrolase [Candidatus Gracilibacteria bacterium]
MSDQPHKIQASILTRLLVIKTARFSELNTNKIPTDSFTFHVNSLINRGYVQKVNGIYLLSTRGKEFANRFDLKTREIPMQGKISVRITAQREAGGKRYFLLTGRLKDPFAGKVGFIGGKVQSGETIFRAAEHVFEEYAGCRAAFRLLGIQHKMDYDTEGNLLEDKYFYIMEAQHIEGEVSEGTETNRNMWVTKEEIRELAIFENIPEALSWLDKDELSFSEKQYMEEGF